MPLRAARVGRVGVIRAPVAKTAVVARAVTPGPAPMARTAVVAAAVTPGHRRDASSSIRRIDSSAEPPNLLEPSRGVMVRRLVRSGDGRTSRPTLRGVALADAQHDAPPPLLGGGQRVGLGGPV